MSNHMTEARPYAKAIFELALEDQSLAAWSQALSLLAEAVAMPEMMQLIDDPAVADALAPQVLLDVVHKHASDSRIALGQKLDNALALLQENKRLLALVDIAEQFSELKAAHENKVHVVVTSASEMTNAQKQAMQQKLQQRFDTDVDVEYAIDTDLLGGAVIQAGNWVMDGSIKGKIARMSEDLLT